MADFTASIFTLANAALVAIEKTVKYIKEIQCIPGIIRNLLVHLKDLDRLVRIVTSTCNRAGIGEEHPSSRFVARTLAACQDRLAVLEPLVVELASHESETLKQKLILKWRSDKFKKEIGDIIKNIHCDMEYIRTGLSCWSLEEQRAIRRLSEAMAERHAANVRATLEENIATDMNSITRSMSEADTISCPLTDIDHRLQRCSTVPSRHSRDSLSSSSSWMPQTPSDRSNSVATAASPEPVVFQNDQEAFHFQLAKCFGDKHRIERVREMLQGHPEHTLLVNSRDLWNRTPMHLAAQRGDVEVARIMLEFGADKNAKDSEPSSVLDLAIADKHRHFVAFLIENGVDESAVLPRNISRFKEMKRAIQFEQSARKKKIRRQ